MADALRVVLEDLEVQLTQSLRTITEAIQNMGQGGWDPGHFVLLGFLFYNRRKLENLARALRRTARLT